MREILFRGKRVTDGEWVYGSLVHRTSFYGDPCDDYLILSDGEFDCDYYEADRVENETVGQYTGLTDKNGKKIFEGDIVDASDEWWNAAGPAGHDSPFIVVEWSDSFCGFEPFANYDCDCEVYINCAGCEIIGNVYDNT